MGDLKLTDRDLERYSRQIMIDGIGEEGQRKLKNSTVAVFGLGGLGSPATIYLAVAGVGKLILADCDRPDLSNLNRQILHWEEDVEAQRSKVESSARKIRSINSDIEVVEENERVTGGNIGEMFGEADLIVDCLDDFNTRLMMNKYCVENDTPFVHAAVEGLHGQVTSIKPGKTPCLRCMFPTPPPKAETFPILGATAAVLGALEAVEAVKIITRVGEPLFSRLMIADLMHQQWEVIEVERVPDCEACCPL